MSSCLSRCETNSGRCGAPGSPRGGWQSVRPLSGEELWGLYRALPVGSLPAYPGSGGSCERGRCWKRGPWRRWPRGAHQKRLWLRLEAAVPVLPLCLELPVQAVAVGGLLQKEVEVRHLVVEQVLPRGVDGRRQRGRSCSGGRGR